MTNLFWADEHVEFIDAINNEIWAESPSEQTVIQQPAVLRDPRSVGAQQAMLDGPPLPWVPDLIGRRWQHPDSIIIIGSAYAPFIHGISRRKATLPLDRYRASRPAEFLRSFLEYVVRPDADYYGKIALLAKDQENVQGVGLFDLCRASFAIRGTRTNGDLDRAGESTFKRHGAGSDEAARASRLVFTRYVASARQRAWTKWRFEKGLAKRILALGSIAEHGLLRFFYDIGIKDIRKHCNGEAWSPRQYDDHKWVLHYADPRQTLGRWLDEEDWWVIKGRIGDTSRTWHLLPTLHPCRSNYDPNYRRTRDLIKKMHHK